MTFASIIYIISISEALRSALVAITATSLMALLLCLFMSLMLSIDEYSGGINGWGFLKSVKFAKIAFITLLISGLFTILIPKKETSWMMLGAYAAQEVYQSETGVKVKQIISNKLDKILSSQLEEKEVDKKKSTP